MFYKLNIYSDPSCNPINEANELIFIRHISSEEEKTEVEESELRTESDSKFDNGFYVNCSKSLNNIEKISVLHNVWMPDVNYKFPAKD